MSDVTVEEAQTAYDNALAVTLVINVAIGGLFIVLFEICRQFFPNIYYSRANLPTFEKESVIVTPPKKHPLGWLRSCLFLQEEQLLETHGLDVVMHLKFQKYVILILLLQLIYGIVILFPVNGTASNKDLEDDDPEKTYGSAIISMSNVPRESYRLLAHTFSMIYNTVITAGLLLKLYYDYIRLRRIYREEAYAESYSVMIRDIPPNMCQEDKLRKIFDDLYPNEVVSLRLTPDAQKLLKLEEERMQFVRKLEKAEAEFLKKGERPMVNKRILIGPKVDAIDFFTEEVKKREEKIKTGIKEKDLPSTGVAFITFKTIKAAKSCSQVSLQHIPFTWTNEPAPQPEDINWMKLSIRHFKRLIYTIIINVATFFLVFFWMIPVGFVSSLSNLTTISQLKAFDWLIFIIDLNSAVRGFIEGFLPSLALIIFMALLVLIIQAMVFVQGLLTHSAARRSVFSKFFLFQVINVFLTYLLTGSFLGFANQFSDYVESPLDVVNLLATSIPKQSNFYINYILVHTWIKYGLFLWRPVDIIMFFLKKKLLAKSKRDFQEMYNPPIFYYPVMGAEQILMFIIIVCYSTIAPLILPFGLVYYFFVYCSSKYNLLYVFKQPYDAGGTLWPAYYNRMMFGLLLYQVVLIGVFSINRFPIGAGIGVVLFLLTGLKWYQVPKALGKQSMFGTFFDELKEKDHERVDVRKFSRCYVHPLLKSLPQPQPQGENAFETPQNDDSSDGGDPNKNNSESDYSFYP